MAAAGAEDNGYTEKQPYIKQAADKRGSNIKITMGRQGPRMGPHREKGAFAPAHQHLTGNGHSAYLGNRA
jgi:hypothetical protein